MDPVSFNDCLQNLIRDAIEKPNSFLRHVANDKRHSACSSIGLNDKHEISELDVRSVLESVIDLAKAQYEARAKR
jgi:hypothetical protein